MNEASRMDSTGVPDSIQVTKDAAQVSESDLSFMSFLYTQSITYMHLNAIHEPLKLSQLILLLTRSWHM